MADDLGVQFFTTANTQHESVTKWHLIVLAVLAYLHLALVVPFAEQTAKKAKIESDVAAKQAVVNQLAPIVTSVKAFEDLVQSNVDSVAAELQRDLIARFAVLNDKVGQLVLLGPQEAAGPPGEQVFKQQQIAAGQSQQQQQQQQAQPEPVVAPMLEAMRPDLRARVAANAPYPDEQYIQDMGSYISDIVIAPAFIRANEAWTSVHRPIIVGAADKLDSQLRSAVPNDGTGSARLGELRELIATLRDRGQKLTFAPPEDSEWWRTVAGKAESIRTMIDDIKKGIEDVASQEAALQTLKNQVAHIVQQEEQTAKDLAAELENLDRQAREVQAQLGEIGGPLKVIAVKLDILAPVLPLIIGLAAAAMAVWRSEFLQRMRFAASLVEDDTQGRAVRGWLRSAAGGSAVRLTAKEIAIGAVMIAWVLAAGRSTSSLPAPFSSHMAIVGLAIAGVAVGGAYHWYRSWQALDTAERA